MSAPADVSVSVTGVVVMNMPGIGAHVGVAAFGSIPASGGGGGGGGAVGGGGGGFPVIVGGGGGGFGGGVEPLVPPLELEELSPPQATRPTTAVPATALTKKSARTV